MKIALLMKRYSLFRGGGEYDLVRLSRSLLERGHEVHLFVHSVEGEVDPNLRLHLVPMFKLWAPVKILSFAWNVATAVKKSGLCFDVIHAMTQTYPSDLYWNGGGLQVNWLKIRYGPRALRWAWFNPRHAANLYVEKQLFKPGNYCRVVALSPNEKAQLLDGYQVPPERFHVIPNGIDNTRFNPAVRSLYRREVRQTLGISHDTLMLLFVGTDGLRKGLPQLFNALSAMNPSFDGRLVIAGNDPPGRWLPLVQQLGLEQRVKFAGQVPQIEQYYGAADLVVMPSLFEGYGNVIPEAMACGCAVLTTRQVGASFLVEEGVSGYVLDSCRNIGQFTHVLETSRDQRQLEAMGTRAGQQIRTCTWDRTVDELEAVYRLIVEEKKQCYVGAQFIVPSVPPPTPS